VQEQREVGPYLLLELLGSGGMGHVYLARDPRLDRLVAVKCIRAQCNKDSMQARFLREARIAAKLSHPAIISIHDIIENDEGVWIVMEYVEGQTLDQWAQTNRPGQRRLITLLSRVARGLAAAHRAQIVHRDLKVENVLVGSDGFPKIADFGLARHEDGEQNRLTDTGAVMGTVRSMAPEQALGQVADYRADLFSFGVMAYELVSGTSPFQRNSGPATLHAIAYEEPPPIENLVPGLHRALAQLVGGLLQKNPNLRPQDTGALAENLKTIAAQLPEDEASETGSFFALSEGVAMSQAITQPGGQAGTKNRAADKTTHANSRLSPVAGRRLFGLAVASMLLVLVAASAWLLWPDPLPSLEVLVLPVEYEGEDPMLPLVVREALLENLPGFHSIHPVDAQGVTRLPKDPVKAAAFLNADELIKASLTPGKGEDQKMLTLRRLDAGAHVLWSDTFPINASFEVVRAAVGASLSRTYGSRKSDWKNGTISAEDYTLFLSLRQQASQGEAPAPIVEALTALRKQNPGFYYARIWEIKMLGALYTESRDDTHLDRARKLLATAEEIRPDDARLARLHFDLAHAANDQEAAEAALNQMIRTYPTSLRIRDYRVRLLTQQGDMASALAEADRIAVAYPSVPRNLNLAVLAHEQGNLRVLRRSLDWVLVRDPDNRSATLILANNEIKYGDPDRAIDLLQPMAHGDDVPVLVSLATALMLSDRLVEAETHLRRTVTLLPEHPEPMFNLADCLDLAGAKQEAELWYERVLSKTDDSPDGQLLAAQAQAHLGRQREALETLAPALKAAGESAESLFAAALVHTLVGDKVSARFYRDKSLNKGMTAKWFELSWFEPLAHSP